MGRTERRSLLAAAILAAFASLTGLLSAHAVGQAWYMKSMAMLLAIGLFFAAFSIDLEQLRRNWRLILAAVTIGVVMKAAIIGAVMAWVFADPSLWVVAISVAQIDPVSTNALNRTRSLSDRTRAILGAWSSLDDPATAILTIYVPELLKLLGVTGVASLVTASGGGSGYARSVLINLVLVSLTYTAWRGIECWSNFQRMPQWWFVGVGALVILAALVSASWYFLMAGVAIVGLSVRPNLGWLESWAPRVAYVGAAFFVFVLLWQGVNLVQGLALGVVTYLSQIVAAMVLVRGVSRTDRWRIALAQQNGITAVILALAQEAVRPGTVATVAPAILAVSALYFGANRLARRWLDAADRETAAVG